jgi:hypothetical protein
MLKLARNGCAIDIQIHVGSCTDPTDFLAFEKIMVLLGALPSDYSTTELGAFDANQEAIVGETLTFEGLDYFELVPIRDEEVASTEIQQEVVQTIICDSKTCGECGLPSDGCQISFTVEKAHGGSPGLFRPRDLHRRRIRHRRLHPHQHSAVEHGPERHATCVGTNLVVISSRRQRAALRPDQRHPGRSRDLDPRGYGLRCHEDAQRDLLGRPSLHLDRGQRRLHLLLERRHRRRDGPDRRLRNGPEPGRHPRHRRAQRHRGGRLERGAQHE